MRHAPRWSLRSRYDAQCTPSVVPIPWTIITIARMTSPILDRWIVGVPCTGRESQRHAINLVLETREDLVIPATPGFASMVMVVQHQLGPDRLQEHDVVRAPHKPGKSGIDRMPDGTKLAGARIAGKLQRDRVPDDA